MNESDMPVSPFVSAWRAADGTVTVVFQVDMRKVAPLRLDDPDGVAAVAINLPPEAAEQLAAFLCNDVDEMTMVFGFRIAPCHPE